MYRTPNGTKKKRYADVVALDSKNRIMEIHQVGKVTKIHKKPVSRDEKQFRDIRNSPDYNGAKIKYHRYN